MRTQNWAKMQKNFCRRGGGEKTLWGILCFLSKKLPEAKILQIFIIHQKTHIQKVSANPEWVKWELF